MSLIESADYPDIRDAIDLGLTEASVPASKIERDIFKGRAEAWVARAVDVESLDEEGLSHAKQAAILYCASLLAPSTNIPTSDAVSGIGASYTRKVEEPAAKARRLRGEAEAELALLTEEDEITDVKPFSGSVRNVSVW